jgi:hypothetical protein
MHHSCSSGHRTRTMGIDVPRETADRWARRQA